MTAPVRAIEAADAAGGRIDIALVDAASIGDGFRDEWRALEASAASPNPFFSSWFLEPALKHLAKGDVRLCAMRRGALLVGLFPVETGRTYAKLPLRHFTVWKHEHCYNSAPLLREGFAAECYGALLDWIDTYPEGARFLRFAEYPLTDESFGALEDACAKRRRKIFFQRRRERAVLSGGRAAEDVLAAAFSAKKRKELRRQARRLGDAGEMAYHRLADPADINAAAQTFLSLELKGWKGRREDAAPMARSEAESAFFLEAMAAGAREGAVFCDRLDAGGDIAAMFFTLRGGDMLCAFKISHDEAFSAHSPGVLLLMQATRRALEDKTARLFDSCARSGHPLADKVWRERIGVAQINIPAGGAMDAPALSFCAALEKAKRSLTGRES